MNKLTEIKLSEIVFDESIYPRKKHNPGAVIQYADNMEAIEEKNNFIHVDYKNRLLDGRHRHLAYLTIANGATN